MAPTSHLPRLLGDTRGVGHDRVRRLPELGLDLVLERAVSERMAVVLVLGVVRLGGGVAT